MQRELGRTVAAAPNWNLSRVIDATVKDADGDNLGQIKDVVLDPATGRARRSISETAW